MQKNKNSNENFEYNNSLKEKTGHFTERFFKLNKYLYRPIASVVVRLLFNTKITPNHVTIFSFLWSVAAAGLFFLGGHENAVIGAILVQGAQVLDCADGMLARAKNISSDFGAFLDIFLDRVSDFLFIAGISYGVYRTTRDIDLLLISFFGIGLYFLQICLHYLTNQYNNKKSKGETEEGRAVLLLAILVFGLLNRFYILIYLIFIEGAINLAARLVGLIRLRIKAAAGKS